MPQRTDVVNWARGRRLVNLPKVRGRIKHFVYRASLNLGFAIQVYPEHEVSCSHARKP